MSHQPQEEISFKYKGVPITIEPRYLTGHVLSLEDAALINRAWITNARAAFSETADVLIEANASLEEIARSFIEFLRKWKYEPQRTSLPDDPIVTRARALAREEVRTALRDAGGTIKATGEAKFNAACTKHYDNNKDRLHNQAREYLEIMSDF